MSSEQRPKGRTGVSHGKRKYKGPEVRLSTVCSRCSRIREGAEQSPEEEEQEQTKQGKGRNVASVRPWWPQSGLGLSLRVKWGGKMGCESRVTRSNLSRNRITPAAGLSRRKGSKNRTRETY